MKRRYVITGGVMVLLVAGAFVALSGSTPREPKQSLEQPSASNEVEVTATEQSFSTPVAGQYIDYTPGVIENTEGPKLLFFHADWCSQCRAIDASIAAQGVPKGVSIIKVDYDTADDLRSKYKVTLQTTFVRIDDAGNEIKKFVAYNEPDISSVRRELL